MESIAPDRDRPRADLAATETPEIARPTRAEAESAVRTLLLWAGDNPDREGLLDTPRRVVKAYEEYFCGYDENPADHLRRTFEEVAGYDDMVLVRGIAFDSHCEHHLAPIQGVAHVAYVPSGRIVGLSKLARVVELYARRLQVQEKLTAQVADALEDSLAPLGVAVQVEATHGCMSCRGVRKVGADTVTTVMRGQFRTDTRLERRFLDAAAQAGSPR
ncbi:GTP cyclohydrolase I FolE [Rhodothalassium salexigens]|uniref:GTP cyclohydrolase I FolE n=1 Tax=Rhodothalassium salexigens TaxID=1086 RepID=UPI00191399D9|nr:GTP cyclohydrolase I FolE [Rhodothalassium salexigens]MBK5920278.1 GTP cyclohydrolase I FolE [Rhodothalassium salexigens]